MQTGTCGTCGRQEVLQFGFCSQRCRDNYRPPSEIPQPERKIRARHAQSLRHCHLLLSSLCLAADAHGVRALDMVSPVPVDQRRQSQTVIWSDVMAL